MTEKRDKVSSSCMYKVKHKLKQSGEKIKKNAMLSNNSTGGSEAIGTTVANQHY